ncbi:hypothetical protein ccbrp13_39880 [Ktedonobacteria bacterium brp13]|nr:hypothetical protein ccbrp13_39880 [Ktedonobacteria bacterium brp13]
MQVQGRVIEDAHSLKSSHFDLTRECWSIIFIVPIGKNTSWDWDTSRGIVNKMKFNGVFNDETCNNSRGFAVSRD